MKSILFPILTGLPLLVSSATVAIRDQILWDKPCNTEGGPRNLNITFDTPPQKQATVVIQTYVNVVNTHAKQGQHLNQINQTIEVLNNGFSGTEFQFRVIGIREYLDAAWAIGATDTENRYMKSFLRNGTYATLNLYIQSDQRRFGGEATFPHAAGPFDPPAEYATDGVILSASTLPGNPLNPSVLGIATIHEVGHWLDLFHPFEAQFGNPCLFDGDFCPDTPFQSDPHTGLCPPDFTVRSCPNELGFDSIHNYMAYTNDLCKTEFTPNQKMRMSLAWTMFRAGN